MRIPSRGRPDPTDTARDEKLALLLADLMDRAQEGETVEIETVCREHPEMADEIRSLWGTMMVAEVAGSSPTADSGSGQGDPLVPLPTRVGDLELLEEIGRGGMGVVYRARELSLNRFVAVKMMIRSGDSEQDRERFRAEAEAAARLNYPGIVPVYSVGEHEGRPWIAMKLIQGETLSLRLTEGPLPQREAAKLIAEVARAIDFAHESGVLHRDLKPANILIDEEGRPHVTDFGLAKQLTVPASLTHTGAVLGTPAYMSPEQAGGQRVPLTPASDVYSLGALLYHALTGRPPFSARSTIDNVLMVLEQDPTPPRSVNPTIDRDLEMIVIRCLQKPPDLRYDSAAALAADLEAYLKDEPVQARSGRLGQVVARWFRETHHATVLENWGLLWMWHSLALLIACLLTSALQWTNNENRWNYFVLWTVGFGAWAGVFWALRRRMGPVTFVERQIAHIWAASLIGVAALFPLEWRLGLPPLQLSPIVGLTGAMVFLVKAGILSGVFYVQAAALFLTSIAMAVWPDIAHLLFGIVSAACFFFPGLKYHRQRRLQESAW